MKRAKLAPTTSGLNPPPHPRTSAVAEMSVSLPRKSVGIGQLRNSTQSIRGDMSKRKSCPAGSVAVTATSYVTAERVQNIFDESSEMPEAERKREIKRIVLTLSGYNKSQQQGLDIKVLSSILKVLQNHIDNINEETWNIVVQIIQYALSPKTCGSCFSELEKLVTEILVHRPNYVNSVAQLMISKFVRLSNVPIGAPDDGPSVAELKCFDVSIKLFCRIVEAVGVKMLSRPLLNILSSSYPYVLRPPLTHFYYIRNLLSMNKMVGSSLTACVLSVTIHKITQLDALLSRNLLDCESVQSLVLPKQEKTGNLTSFLISEEDSEEFVVEILKAYAKVEQEVDQIQQIATLDVCLSYLISYLAKAHDAVNFNALLSIFETEVLPTFSTNSVQFIFFYLINLKEEYLHAFLNFLWKKFSNISTPAVLRVQAIGYIAGVLARSLTADRRTVKRWMSRLSTYAQEYLDSKSSNSSSHWSNVNVHAHGPFYAVCQAIFYIFAFRHFELVYGTMQQLKDEEKHDKQNIHSFPFPPPTSASQFIYSLNLQRLITSDLNPLKACAASVAKTFVTAAHAYQISYCKTVLERNNRASIKNMIFENMRDASNNSEDSCSSILNDSFFPFDPLPLPYCKMIVDDGFREYDGNSLALLLVGEANGASSMKDLRENVDDADGNCDDLDFDDDIEDDRGALLVCE